MRFGLLAGYLLDRIFAPYLAVAFFLAPLAGILLLLCGLGPSVAAIATVLVSVPAPDYRHLQRLDGVSQPDDVIRVTHSAAF